MPPKAPLPFRAFDECGAVRVYYHGLLPYWRQAGCTYFVKFRLADSIPRPVLEEIDHERALWLRARGIDPAERSWQARFAALPAAERRLCERLVGRMINQSLDNCLGSCLLRELAVGNLVATALDYFHGSRVLTGDFRSRGSSWKTCSSR